MKCSVRRALGALTVAALALTAAGCSDQDPVSADAVVSEAEQVPDTPYEVTYEVTGAGVGSLDFNDGRSETVRKGKAVAVEDVEMVSVMAPGTSWRRTVELKGLDRPMVSAVANGKAACRISHKGKTLAEEVAEGSFASVLCVADSPHARR